jgi:hypothetical protein
VRFSIGNPLAETTLFSASLICPPTTAHESSQASSTAPSSAWDTPPVTYPHERQESRKSAPLLGLRPASQLPELLEVVHRGQLFANGIAVEEPSRKRRAA